jgi:EAL domain-containing protein (putative c-di-GMP-specific phosphodiesterase class I)
MKIRTVAEFVTDESTLQLVKGAGVHDAQGYHIGRPAPMREVLGTAG